MPCKRQARSLSYTLPGVFAIHSGILGNDFLNNKQDPIDKRLLEIAPIEKDPDHDSQQTGCHTDQIGRHNAETGPKPPADPAKNGNTQKKNNFFHINRTKSSTGKRTCETPGAGTKPALGFTP